ncbi:hypothetical protein ACHAPI_011670, partial [Fusarium lateritium]
MDTVAADERCAPGFAQLSKALKVNEHPVWDKDGKRFDLEASVDYDTRRAVNTEL